MAAPRQRGAHAALTPLSAEGVEVLFNKACKEEARLSDVGALVRERTLHAAPGEFASKEEGRKEGMHPQTPRPGSAATSSRLPGRKECTIGSPPRAVTPAPGRVGGLGRNEGTQEGRHP